jgi:two-component system, cell cycle response regulator DivK
MTTILVIEDNLQNMYLMRFLLEKHGFAVLSATDGQEGIDMASRMRPDCILLDIQLPKLDGYGVASALRADSSLNDIPIIAVTSYAMMGDREKALACGATDYIEKPIDPERFVDQIRKHLPTEPQPCREL